MDAVVDQLGLIIEIDNLNPLRQCFVNFRNLTLNAIDDFLGVLVDALENNSRDDFALTVFGDGALTNLVANLDAGHVADANRRAAPRIEHDVLNVFNVLNQAETADDVLFVAMLDEIGSGVLIVRLDRFEQRLERDVVINQGLLIDNDLVLLYIAAKAQHVGDAGNGAQLQLYDPILDRAQLLVALPVSDDLIKVNLTSAGSDRTHGGLET